MHGAKKMHSVFEHDRLFRATNVKASPPQSGRSPGDQGQKNRSQAADSRESFCYPSGHDAALVIMERGSAIQKKNAAAMIGLVPATGVSPETTPYRRLLKGLRH
jgi:hypothetical protein